MNGEDERFGLIRGSSNSPELSLDKAGYNDPIFVRDTGKTLTEAELYAEFHQANARYDDLMGWNY